MYIKYNDYELLYLINEGSEEAYYAMIEKYTFLIYRKLYDFRIKPKYRDDFFQEGLIVLKNAIKSFDEYKGKTFTKFFEMVLGYRFQRLLYRESKYFFDVTLVEYPEMIVDNHHQEEVNLLEKFDDCIFSEMEYEILKYIALGYKPREIAKIKNTNSRSIYNTLARVKGKIKHMSA